MTLCYKMKQILLAILLQNATKVYYKNALAFFLGNMTALLRNATVMTKCDDFITKWDSYHKMQHL